MHVIFNNFRFDDLPHTVFVCLVCPRDINCLYCWNGNSKSVLNSTADIACLLFMHGCVCSDWEEVRKKNMTSGTDQSITHLTSTCMQSDWVLSVTLLD